MKKIVFIPPNGHILAHDFSINRILKYLQNVKNITTVLIKIDSHSNDTLYPADKIINVNNKQELFQYIKEENPSYIFHRSWMMGYSFAAELVKNFDNVIVNIKDWNFSTKKQYEVMFKKEDSADFEAIDYIFKNSILILSHYTDEQAQLWANEYNVNKKKFKFFPEYCNEDKFYNKGNIDYSVPKIVYAGTMCPTSFPEEHFPCKSYLRSIRKVTKGGLDVTYVLVKSAYAATQDPKRRDLFLDILYEDKFNSYFHLKEGRTHDPSVLEEYHFGFFHLEDSAINQGLTRYAVPSKFAFYLESGLPLLINSKMRALSKIVTKHKIGVVFSNSELEILPKKLKSIKIEEYLSYIENIKKFRKKFTYSNEIENIFKI